MPDDSGASSPALPIDLPPSDSPGILICAVLGAVIAIIAAFFPHYAFMIFLATVLGCFVVTLSARPLRSILAWTATIGIQVSSANLPMPRLGIADVVILPAIVRLFVTGREGLDSPVRLMSSMGPWILSLLLLLVISTLISLATLGYLTTYVLIQKDVGLLLLLAAFYSCLAVIRTQQQLESMIRLFIIAGSFQNVLGVLGAIARLVFGIPNPMMWENTSFRLSGLLLNPNGYGAFVGVVICLQAALVLGQNPLMRWPRRIEIANLALLMLGLVLTLSRSSWVATMIGLTLLFVRYILSSPRLLLVPAALAIALIILYNSLDVAVIETQSEIAANPRTLFARADVNRVALGAWASNEVTMVTGMGVGVFLERSTELTHASDPLIIHNTFLWALVELGLVGFFIVIGLLYRALTTAYRSIKMAAASAPLGWGVFASISMMIIWMMANEGLYQRQLWFLFAVSELLARRLPSEPERSSPSRYYGKA